MGDKALAQLLFKRRTSKIIIDAHDFSAIKTLALNVGGIVDEAYALGKDDYPWLSTIYPYGHTMISPEQAPHMVKELEKLRKHLDSRQQATLDSLKILLKNLKGCEYLEFSGD